MRADTPLPVLLLIVATMTLAPVVQAKEAVKMPDLDLIEFIGTFETDRGKEIDPLLLDSMPAVKPPLTKARPKKMKSKRNESPKKEGKQ
jgi:hypothetical protein